MLFPLLLWPCWGIGCGGSPINGNGWGGDVWASKLLFPPPPRLLIFLLSCCCPLTGGSPIMVTPGSFFLGGWGWLLLTLTLPKEGPVCTKLAGAPPVSRLWWERDLRLRGTTAGLLFKQLSWLIDGLFTVGLVGGCGGESERADVCLVWKWPPLLLWLWWWWCCCCCWVCVWDDDPEEFDRLTTPFVLFEVGSVEGRDEFELDEEEEGEWNTLLLLFPPLLLLAVLLLALLELNSSQPGHSRSRPQHVHLSAAMDHTPRW